MTITNFDIIHPSQIDGVADHLRQQKLPVKVTVTHMTAAQLRSAAQNRLMHKWFRDIAKSELGWTPEEARAYSKLHIGVPILRRREAFKQQYDTALKPLPYAKKLLLMDGPLELPVTSVMTPKEMTEFLNTMHQQFAEEHGVALALPDEELING